MHTKIYHMFIIRKVEMTSWSIIAGLLINYVYVMKYYNIIYVIFKKINDHKFSCKNYTYDIN